VIVGLSGRAELRHPVQFAFDLVDFPGLDSLRNEIDGEGWPQGQGRIEKVDRKVAGKTTIGEPTAFKRKFAFFRTALRRNGKLKLMRAPSRIGRSAAFGRP